MDLSNITDRELLTSLRSDVCPACGRAKKPNNTLCLADYRKLPTGARARLYDLLGRGYREAIGAAFELLGRSHFSHPGGGRTEVRPTTPEPGLFGERSP